MMPEINQIEKMTPEEFQRKLWIWLEEKGIFSEMKTQLRKHMIEVLKSSEIGNSRNNLFENMQFLIKKVMLTLIF